MNMLPSSSFDAFYVQHPAAAGGGGGGTHNFDERAISPAYTHAFLPHPSTASTAATPSESAAVEGYPFPVGAVTAAHHLNNHWHHSPAKESWSSAFIDNVHLPAEHMLYDDATTSASVSLDGGLFANGEHSFASPSLVADVLNIDSIGNDSGSGGTKRPQPRKRRKVQTRREVEQEEEEEAMMEQLSEVGALHQGLDGTEDEPLYVNPKQYNRILKRREVRARMEEKRRRTEEAIRSGKLDARQYKEHGGHASSAKHDVDDGSGSTKTYQHESRHKHAMRRARGPGGRFLTAEEIKAREAAAESLSQQPQSAVEERDEYDDLLNLEEETG